MVCDNCWHKDVCVFENSARQQIKELKISRSSPLIVEISCRHFSTERPERQDITDQYSAAVLNTAHSDWRCPIIEDTFIY
jgi:ubiquitin C-terminal hydrolase